MKAARSKKQEVRNKSAFFSLLLTSCLLLLSFGCAPHYHVIRLSKGVDETGQFADYFAVTRNGIVIPEYVIDERGIYPDSKEEAWKRFRERKDRLESLVRSKYELPNDTAYEVKRNSIGFGLVAVSPVLAPLQLIQKASNEEKSGVSLPQRDYLEMAFEEPVPKEPQIKDELSASS